MHIKFKHIHAENFLSYETMDIDLDNKGYVLISGRNENPDDNSGSNGSGKSSMWEALSWCLTGETIRGSKEVKRLGSDGTCLATVEFSIDNTEYSVTRTKDPSNLKLFVNGEDKSGKGIRDTQTVLEEHLPDFTPQFIGSVIIMGQGLPMRFTNNSPSGRKDVLEKLSKSDFMIEDVKNRVAKRVSALNEKIRGIEDRAIELTSKTDMCKRQQAQAEDALANIPDSTSIQSEVDKLEAEVLSIDTEINNQIVIQSSLEETVTKKAEEISNAHKQSNALVDQICEKYRDDIEKAKKDGGLLESKIYSLKNEIAKLENIKDVCPTCGQKLPNVTKVDTSGMRAELQTISAEAQKKHDEAFAIEKQRDSEVAEEKKRLQKSLETLNAESSENARKLGEIRVLISDKNRKLSIIKDTIARHKSTLVSIDSKKAQCLETIEKCKKDVVDFEQQLLYNTSEHDEVQAHIDVEKKFETLIKRDFRGYLLTNVIEFVDKKAKEYSQTVFGTDKIRFCLDGNNISISYCDKEYECLSGGERAKCDIIIQLAIRDMMCAYLNFSSNILAIDEIFDGLDAFGCERVIELISTKLTDLTSIFTITHHKDLSIPYDCEINVVKGSDGISRIRQ